MRQKSFIAAAIAALVWAGSTQARTLSSSPGNSSATITITFSADGRSATIVSSKGISHYVYAFCDGTSRKVELTGEIRSLTIGPFSAPLASVSVKAGTTVETATRTCAPPPPPAPPPPTAPPPPPPPLAGPPSPAPAPPPAATQPPVGRAPATKRPKVVPKRPHAARCEALVVRPASLVVGLWTQLRVVVKGAGKPIRGVSVLVRGRRIQASARTNARGLARIRIRPRTTGIVRVLVRGSTRCQRRLSAVGVVRPAFTG